MMTREFRSGEEEPSELEVVCLEARNMLAEREELSPQSELGDDEFQFDIDCDEVGSYFTPKIAMDDPLPLTRAPFQYGFANGYARNPLSKLDECIEEGEEESDGESPQGLAVLCAQEKIPTVSKLSVSLKNAMLGEKSQNHQIHSGGKADNGYFANSSSGHRSANEQLPASISFVKLADMTEDEWTLFLEKFQELLHPAFAKRKLITLGQKQRQRLGTSCQF